MLVGGRDKIILPERSERLWDVWQARVIYHVFPGLDHDVVALSQDTLPWITDFVREISSETILEKGE